MKNWFTFLKAGLSRTMPVDPLSGIQSGRSVDLQRLKPFFAHHWRKGVLGTGLILFATLLSFPQPLLSRFLVDQVILGKKLDLLLLAVVLLGGVKILEVGAGMLEQYSFARFEQDVWVDLQKSVVDHVLRLPRAFFDEKDVGYLMSRLVADVQGLRWYFSSSVVQIAGSILRLVGGVAFLFILEWRLALVTLIAIPLLVFGARYFSGQLRILSHHRMEQNAQLFQRIEETLASITLVKSFATEQRESRRILDEVHSARQISMEHTVVGSMVNLVMKIVPGLARALVIIVGAYWIIQGNWTLGSLLAFQAYLGYVYGPALTLANANLQLQNALASLERVSNIYAMVPEEDPKAGLMVEHLEGELCFENVSFSYTGRETVLENISFQIQPGEQVVITGHSGVGKTTLLSLLMLFYHPARGQILLDRLPANGYNLPGLRARIGYVTQSTLMLAGTIQDNLCYGNPDATPEQIDRAVGIAGIREFILGLPDGYETFIGERGVNLSEGQKQRLSIARALIKDPDILILDEPTSNVDQLAERSILDALPEYINGKTMIVVTHRLSTIQKANRILLLKDGRLEATGSHLDLLECNAYYRSLFMDASEKDKKALGTGSTERCESGKE